MLKNAGSEWPHASITYLGKPGNYGLSGKRWRYIEYDNGDRELYDIETDRFEWVNLAEKPEHANRIAALRARAPTDFARFVAASDESLPKLKWHAAGESATLSSNPSGGKFDLVLTNKRNDPVKLFSMDRRGNRKSFGTLEAGWRRSLKTRQGAIWLITDAEERPLGHFVIGDRASHAIVPAT